MPVALNVYMTFFYILHAWRKCKSMGDHCGWRLLSVSHASLKFPFTLENVLHKNCLSLFRPTLGLGQMNVTKQRTSAWWFLQFWPVVFLGIILYSHLVLTPNQMYYTQSLKSCHVESSSVAKSTKPVKCPPSFIYISLSYFFKKNKWLCCITFVIYSQKW